MKRIKNGKINLGLNFLLLLFTFQNSINIAWLPSGVSVGKEISKFNLNFVLLGFPGNTAGNESACNAGDLSLIPGSGRSAREGTGDPLQYSGLENSMDCIVLGVTKSQTGLSDFYFRRLPAFLYSSWVSSTPRFCEI